LLEEGTLIDIGSGGKATVELERKSACRKCGACSPVPGGKLIIEASNPAGARPGDRVRLAIEARGITGGIVMTYLLPALGLIFGIFFGTKLTSAFGQGIDPELCGVLAGLVLMLFCFAIARCYNRKKVSYSAQITEVVQASRQVPAGS